MYRYIMLPLLMLPLLATAQFKLEMVAAGGLLLPSVKENKTISSSANTGYYSAAGVDMLARASQPLSPYAGVRMGLQGFRATQQCANGVLDHRINFVALTTTVGMQYRQELGQGMGLRFAAGIGGFTDMGGDAMTGDLNTTGIAEASAGVSWGRMSAALKYIKPIGSYGKTGYFDPPSFDEARGEGYSEYRISALALELKYAPAMPKHLPSSPVRPSRGASGYERKKGDDRVEIGLAAGPAIVEVVERGRYGAATGSGAMALLVVDMYVNTTSQMLCFAHGCRIGADPFGLYSSYVIGMHLNTAPTGNAGFRLSALAGPMLMGWTKPNMSAEGAASVLLGQRFSFGVKYMFPWYNTSDKYWREPDLGSDYSVKYLLAEAKVRFGRK